MASTIRIKRKLAAGGADGPASLSNAELAFNENTQTLYYGLGVSGNQAASIIAIGGVGAFVDRANAQSISGAKTFADNVFINGASGAGKKLSIGQYSTLVQNNGTSDVITLSSNSLSLASSVSFTAAGSVNMTGSVTMTSASAVTVPNILAANVVDGAQGAINATSLKSYIDTRVTNNSIGSVYSVGLSAPGIFTVSNSPVTTTGTLTFALNAQEEKRVLIGPASGIAATPTFRVLQASDLPDLSSTYLPLAGNTVKTMQGDLTIAGNLIVQGDTTTLNTQTLTVEDALIELGKVSSPTNTTANGGGISLEAGVDGDKTIIWDSTNSNWTSSEHWNIASGKTYKINNIALFDAYSATYSAYPLSSAVIVDGGEYT